MSQALVTYDTPTMMAGGALAINVATSAYFYYRIRELETELAEVKKHLATIVPTTDPTMKLQITKIIEAINQLGNKVVNLENIAAGSNRAKSNKDDSPKRSYVRLTSAGRDIPGKVTRSVPIKNLSRKSEDFQMSQPRRMHQGHQLQQDRRMHQGYGKDQRTKSRKAVSSTSPTSATSVADSEESSTSSDSEMDESFENDIAAMM